MKKVLIFVRTSTEAQETEAQKLEMINFCHAQGYERDNMIIIEDQGASAIKLNQKYLDMIQEMKKYISQDRDIDCVAFWALDRAWRDEGVYIDIKRFLIERKIQMLIKNPFLQLLNADGTINSGMEVAISLMTILAQQEMQAKKERFKRAKLSMARQGICINEKVNQKFGYKVDDTRHYIPDEEGTAKIVRGIFEIYSKGRVSAKDIELELEARGIKNQGNIISSQQIRKILSNPQYYGEPGVNGRIYPPLTTKELFDKCKKIREQHRIALRRKDIPTIAQGLIKCQCGGTFVSSARQYVCGRHKVGTCDSSISIKKQVIDNLLWRVASICEIDYLYGLSEEKEKEIDSKLEILSQKITTADDKLSRIEEKKQRVVDLYIDNLISKEVRDKKLNSISKEAQALQHTLQALRSSEISLQALRPSAPSISVEEKLLQALSTLEANEENLKYVFEVVHKHITLVSITKMVYRTYMAFKISITTHYGAEDFLYCPYAKIQLYISNGKDWIADHF